MSTDLIIYIASQLFVGGVIWGGIRMDIKNIHAAVKRNKEDISYAHKRIDVILLNK